MNGLKKNLGYQTIYQILNVGLPLITAPFLARVLGAEALGIMSYTSSVAHYFTLFAMMGLTNYGTRSIAVVKDDRKKRDITFSQIFYMQIATASLAFVAYCIYMVFFCKDNTLISWIQGISVIACFFDINWFFFGIEKFKITVFRSMIIRVTSVSLMLLLVKTPADLWIYAILLVGSTFVSQVVLWFYAPKFLALNKPDFTSIKKHFGSNVYLFIPLLAMSVYHIMDKTMLGILSTYTQSGYYYNADKLINIPIGLLTGVGTVMLPRMSALASLNQKEHMDAMFNKSIRAIGLVSAAMCCGIAAVSKEFIPFFFGPHYDECVSLVIVLAPVLFVKGLALVARNLYLIPNNLENRLTESVVIGAFVNIVANILLIPKMGALGAVIGTLIAELASCISQYLFIRRIVDFRRSIGAACVYFVLGICMFLEVRLISSKLALPNTVKLIIEIVVGFAAYIIMCMAIWICTKNKSVLNMMKTRFGKR